MAVIGTLGALEVASRDGSSWVPGSFSSGVAMYDGFTQDYLKLWRSQPNVRLCTEFLARNVAKVGVNVFDRISDTNRQRLYAHPLAQRLRRPNPYTTRYRLIEGLMLSLGVWHEGFWLKVRPAQGDVVLVPLDPLHVETQGGLWPMNYKVTIGNREWNVPPEDIVHFRCSAPGRAFDPVSPLETLRRVLAEEDAAVSHREGFWRNGARIAQYVSRPAEAPEWGDDDRERFRAELAAFYTGAVNSGKVAVFEDGMELRKGVFSPDESEYTEGRKLSREECARAYHIPPPMVGILENATLANVSEYKKILAWDTLEPWTTMIAEDIELQLLAEYEPDPATTVYIEFDIARLLKGTPTEELESLVQAAGGPIIVVDEARARLDLNDLPDGAGAELIRPLNLGTVSDPQPQVEAPKATPRPMIEVKASRMDHLRESHVSAWNRVAEAHFKRQQHVVDMLLDRKAPASAVEIREALEDPEWDRALSIDFAAMNWQTARTFGALLAKRYGLEWTPEVMRNWLRLRAEKAAAAVNTTTRSAVLDALAADPGVDADAVRHVFDVAVTARAAQVAVTAVTTAKNFGEHDAAKHGGLTQKTWVVTSAHPRASHAALSGSTVAIDDAFGNGMRFPGDPAGTVDERAGCTCDLSYSTTGE